MTLDDLYGAGAQDEFEPLVAPPSAQFTYASIGDGVRVEATWRGDGRMKLDCYPHEVDWQTVQGGKGTGLSRRAHAAGPGWFKKRGVVKYSRSALLDPEAEAVFSRHGDWRDEDGRKVWYL